MFLLSCMAQAAVDPIAESATGDHGYPYRLFTPAEAGTNNRLPLVIFLHGLGERGTDLERHVLAHIQPLIEVTMGATHPAFLVAPQSASGSWDGATVRDLAEHIVATEAVDPSRIYVTGLSAGGQGTWKSVAAGLDFFAAGVPLSAVQATDTAAAIGEADFPIWAFHGDADGVVAVGHTRGMIDLMTAAGGQPRYTERAGWGHSNWAEIYRDNPSWTGTWSGGEPQNTESSLYGWLFAQRRTDLPEPPPPLQPGDTLRIDFGSEQVTSPDASGATWNNLMTSARQSGTLALTLNTIKGEPRSVRVVSTDSFEGENLNGVLSSFPFPEAVSSDSWWTGSFDGHSAALGRAGEIVLGNLPADQTYRLQLLASRSGLDGGASRSTRFTLNGAEQTIEAADNGGTLVSFNGVKPNARGELILRVDVDPDADGRFAYLNALELSTTPPVFPGAVGFGTRTPAGRNGEILRVTNLNASGPGSLKAALEASNPRTIVFDVGGVIDLEGTYLRVKSPYVTVAGATAPSPGITLIKGGVLVESHDVLIQHISVRPGDANGPGNELDGMSIGTGDVYNIVIDRCSFTWGIDENISVSSVPPYPHDVTISHCIIAEGLSESVHHKGEHSKGTLVGHGSQRISMIGNLYAHNYERSPRMGVQTSVVIANNVIYNPGYTAVSAMGGENETDGAQLVMQGNHCIKGVSSRWFIGMISPEVGAIYVWEEDNQCEEMDGTPAPMVVDEGSSSYTGYIIPLAAPEIWPEDFAPRPVAEVLYSVTSTAGSRAGNRAPTDQRIVASVLNRNGRIIDSQEEVGGYPAFTPVTAAASIPANPDADLDANGYTELEEWIHQKNLALASAPGSYAKWAGVHFRDIYGDAAKEATEWGYLANPDADWAPNWLERVFGSDPMQPTSRERLFEMKRGQSGQRLEFSIEPDVPDRAWDLLSSDDLSGWASAKAELGKPQPEGSLLNHVFNFPSEAAGFIRFQYIPAND